LPPARVADVPAPATGAAPSVPAVPAQSADYSLAELEKRHILAVMEKNPSRTQAARVLGISIRTLRNKLNEYGVNHKEDDAGDTEEIGPEGQSG
jgi:DNA-binding NtrC family response regulator